jgi:signal transduction histidine kinase
MIYTFDLIKYFRRATLALVVIVSISIAAISFFLSKKNLQTNIEIMHYQITNILINTIREDLILSIDQLSQLDKMKIKENPIFKKIDYNVRKLFKNSSEILKIKIHNLNAKVIYSTDEDQIAYQGKVDYIGNVTARSGQIQSKTGTKINWDSLKGKLPNVEIIASYVPIRIYQNNHSEIIAVAEIYSDIGIYNQNILKNSLFMGFVSIIILLSFYIFLLLIVQRGAQTIATQTTEIENQKNQLYKSAQLSTLGEMAAGIAHEINNPLMIIEGKARKIKIMISEKTSQENEINEQLEHIRSTVKRISTIVKGLKNISRRGESDPFQTVYIKDIVEETLSLCSEKFSDHSVKLTVLISPLDLQLDCRYVQISQCLLNLVTNAFQEIESLNDKRINIDITSDQTNIILKIIDSGSGVPLDVQDKIFNPMFTTKEVGVGTGLGLSITASIIHQHNGSIRLDNTAQSTTFIITLPKKQIS